MIKYSPKTKKSKFTSKNLIKFNTYATTKIHTYLQFKKRIYKCINQQPLTNKKYSKQKGDIIYDKSKIILNINNTIIWKWKKIFYARQIEKYILPANASLSYKH